MEYACAPRPQIYNTVSVAVGLRWGDSSLPGAQQKIFLFWWLFCILFSQYKYDPNSADWSREMRGKPLLSGVNLTEYMILFTNRDAPKAQVHYTLLHHCLSYRPTRERWIWVILLTSQVRKVITQTPCPCIPIHPYPIPSYSHAVMPLYPIHTHTHTGLHPDAAARGSAHGVQSGRAVCPGAAERQDGHHPAYHRPEPYPRDPDGQCLTMYSTCTCI